MNSSSIKVVYSICCHKPLNSKLSVHLMYVEAYSKWCMHNEATPPPPNPRIAPRFILFFEIAIIKQFIDITIIMYTIFLKAKKNNKIDKKKNNHQLKLL